MNIPFRIFLYTVLLTMVGIVMVYSSSANYVSRLERRRIARLQGPEVLAENHVYHKPDLAVRQTFWLALGLLAMFAAYRVDYHRLKACGPYLLLISLVLLLLVFVPGIGRPIHDHHRWIRIGPLTLQPSEFAKIALIIYMARMLTDHHDRMRSLVHGVLPALALTSVFAVLIVLEPDIGATAIVTAIIFLMWFIGGMRIVHLVGLTATVIPAFVAVILKYPDRVMRILAFVHPTEESSADKGFQLVQSLIAVGSGGTWGVGLGNSMQKHFLTEQYSDFIFAITCEELGLIGAGLIILCFFLLIWEGWRVALRAPDFYACLLASGITLMLTINVTLNLMVVLGLAPTKGLVLPFLSYGGSNMVVSMASMGVLMNVGAYVERGKDAARSARGSRPIKTSRGKRRPEKHSWFRRARP